MPIRDQLTIKNEKTNKYNGIQALSIKLSGTSITFQLPTVIWECSHAGLKDSLPSSYFVRTKPTMFRSCNNCYYSSSEPITNEVDELYLLYLVQ